MDSSFSQKDEIWFMRVCHHISDAVYIILCGRHVHTTRCMMGNLQFYHDVRLISKQQMGIFVRLEECSYIW